MRKLYRFLKCAIPVVLMLTFITNVTAQREIVVPPGSLSDFIHGDTTDTGERIDDNTIYKLIPYNSGGGVYEVGMAINLDVPLQIVGEDPNDYSLIFPKPNATGKYPKMITTKGDIHLENVYISNQGAQGTHGEWGCIKANGKGTSVYYKNCLIEWDLGAMIQVWADSVSIHIEDCIGAKFGGYKSHGGNGRVVSIRAQYRIPKCVVKNNTFYHMQDRVIRNMDGATFDTLIFDHNTVAHVKGYNGSFQLGKVGYLQITNNIIQNPMYMGNHTYTAENTHPDADNHYIFTLDEISANTEINIHHNNIFTDQELLDLFATVDTTSETEILSPLIKAEMGADTADAWFVEPLEFSALPDMPMDYITTIYTDPNPASFPDNFPDPYGIFFIDVSYDINSVSATASDTGGPVGNLNDMGTGINDHRKADFDALLVYPNPVVDVVNFNILLSKRSDITINIFDITGKTVVSKEYSSRSQGENTLTWDISGANMTTGIY
ncbi:MAG: T9SS type A sorting domain-containing protein, partial [Bacteroidota bacterium]|nr:T9SS type A sorting domain-containing protein [Bacteroidota bacterium]